MIFTFGKCIHYSRFLAIFILAFNLFVKLFISVGILPYSAQYFSDVLLVFDGIIVLTVFLRSAKVLKKAVISLFIPVCIFFLIEILSALVNGFDLLLILWHFRNYYRIFAYIFILVICLRREDIVKIFNFLFYVLIAHSILVTAQLLNFYFKFDFNFWHQDYVNGIFGNIKGYNTYSLVFMLIVTGYFLSQYLFNHVLRNKAIISFVLSAWVVAVSELKLYYYLIIAFLGLILIIKALEKKFKKVLVTYLGLAVVIICSYVIMGLLYPYVFGFFFDSNNIKEYTTKTSYGSDQVTTVSIESDSTGKSSDENNGIADEQQEAVISIPKVNRLSAVSIIPEYFFENICDYTLGLGSGNAEYSQNSRFCGEVYNKYGNIGYNKFTYSILLLETGFFGIAAYIMIFIIWMLRLIFLFLKGKKCDQVFYFFGAFMCFVSLIDMIYDAALRSEASYFYGFAIAIGLSVYVEKVRNESKKQKEISGSR